MTQNVCGREKTARSIIGAVLLLVGLIYGSFLSGLIGVVLLLTAVFGYCPISQLFHHTSCPFGTSP
ncbi:MAG: DUF2892 domain-containing protein [Acidobacteriota bacterium]